MISKRIIIHLILLHFCAYSQISCYALTSRIKTEQIYHTPNIPVNHIYSVDVNRVESTQPEGPSRCWSVPRSIKVTSKSQLLRLSKGNVSDNRQKKVYQKLTTLDEQQNIIEQFEIINDKIFVLTSDGKGFFVSIDNSSQMRTVETQFFENRKQRSSDLIVVKQFKERVLLINRNKIVICKYEKSTCDVVGGYSPTSKFRAAQIYSANDKYFLFIVSANEIISYEITANGQLKNRKSYDQSDFGVQKISLRAILRTTDKSLFVLDDIQGIWQMASDTGMSGRFVVQKKLVFQQFGCYQMISQPDAQSVIIACNPTANNFFLMNLIKSDQFLQPTYEPLQTVFMHQRLYQIESVDNILMSRVYEGVKLFWSSKQLGNPYPYFHRSAGTIFLHNAIQSKLKLINQKKIIFLAAEDQLLQYQLNSVDPYVSCYSPIEVAEKYKLTYSVQCQQTFFTGKQNICKKEEQLYFQTWQHKEVRLSTHIIPFVLSLLGVLGMGYAIYHIRKSSAFEVQNARRKYNIQQDDVQ